MILWEKIARTDLLRKHSNVPLSSVEICHSQPLTPTHIIYGTKLVTLPYSFFMFCCSFILTQNFSLLDQVMTEKESHKI